MRASIGSEHESPIAAERILHPAVLLAVTALMLNDHLLKGLHPGLLTGKLSDVAGLVFFPVLLQGLWELALSVLRRPWRRSDRVLLVSTVLTGSAFACAKLTATGAELYRHLFGAVRGLPSALLALVEGDLSRLPVATLTRDPTDVLALPAVLVGVCLMRSAARGK